MKYVVNSVCFTGNFQKPLISQIGFVFSVNIDLFRVSVMRWRPQATSSSGKKTHLSFSLHLAILSLGLSHMCYFLFPQGNFEEIKKFANAGICHWVFSSAFGRDPSGPSSAVWVIVQHHISKMRLLWKKYMSVLSSCRDEPGNAPGHNCIFLPWAVVCTVYICWCHGMGQMMDREKKEDPGSSTQEDLQPLLIFDVDVVQYDSQVFSLYPDWWLKKKTEQRVWIELELLFRISCHQSFVEKVVVLFNLWTFSWRPNENSKSAVSLWKH